MFGRRTGMRTSYRRFRVGPWRVAAATSTGLKRRRQEDAWRVLRRPAATLAVFDGLGGMPNGDRASAAAADALGRAMKSTVGRGDAAMWQTLDDAVRQTRGATTAAIVCLTDGRAWSMGDSAVYVLRDAVATLVNDKDTLERHRISACLGYTDPAEAAAPANMHGANAVLVCTDGVDGVVATGDLTAALHSGDLRPLMASVEAAGAPDNATAIVARRRT